MLHFIEQLHVNHNTTVVDLSSDHESKVAVDLYTKEPYIGIFFGYHVLKLLLHRSGTPLWCPEIGEMPWGTEEEYL